MIGVVKNHDNAVDHLPPAAPTLSHGLGGETDAMEIGEEISPASHRVGPNQEASCRSRAESRWGGMNGENLGWMEDGEGKESKRGEERGLERWRWRKMAQSESGGARKRSRRMCEMPRLRDFADRPITGLSDFRFRDSEIQINRLNMSKRPICYNHPNSKQCKGVRSPV